MTRSVLKAGGVGLLCLLSLAETAWGQIPGVPVLQNAFSNNGLAFAANLGGGGGGGSGGRGYLGAAAAWGFGNRFQLSLGAGTQRARGANRGAYGGRASANVWTNAGGSLGAGAFVGYGGAARTSTNGVVTNPAIMSVPAGVSVGYRRAIGATRGFSVFASPFYAWTRTDSGAAVSASSFRFSTGLDFAINQSFGITAGGEFGGSRGGGAGSSIGAALTFVTGRR